MKVDIISDLTPFDEFFHVRKSVLKFEYFDGTMSPEVTRFSFEKSDAIAVLVHHTSRDAYILVKQFRFPRVHHKLDPWMIEIVAGAAKRGLMIVKTMQATMSTSNGLIAGCEWRRCWMRWTGDCRRRANCSAAVVGAVVSTLIGLPCR